jgi:hypothetical protein
MRRHDVTAPRWLRVVLLAFFLVLAIRAGLQISRDLTHRPAKQADLTCEYTLAGHRCWNEPSSSHQKVRRAKPSGTVRKPPSDGTWVATGKAYGEL